MESVLCGTGRRTAWLRRPLTAERNHSGGVPHGALFPLELWGLSFPDAAAFVDRRAILPDLLYLPQGSADGGAYRWPARFALARCAAAFTGTGILALLCIAEAAVFYGRMFGWYSWGSLAFPALATLLPPLVFALGSGCEALAAVYLDDNSYSSGCAALAGGPGTMERELLHRLSADAGEP